jgi:hypothetical protein
MDSKDNTNEALQKLLATMLESPSLLKQGWLREKAWVAVPIEQRAYVSLVELERLVKATKSSNWSTLMVLFPTNPLAQITKLTVPSSLEALYEATKKPTTSLMITTVKIEFVYHKTDEDFTLFAGARDFVEEALGATLASAFADWESFSKHPCWNTKERDVYLAIRDWYKEFAQP